MRKTIITVYFFTAFITFAQSYFTRGEELFMQNKPEEASVFLEIAVSEDPANAAAYLYLGIAYEQLEKYDEAIAVYRRLLPIAGSLSANTACNLGNVYFIKGNTESAEQFYTQAIGFDSVYGRAYLGRANTRIKAGDYRNAVTDYEQYLTLEPRSPQRQQIEQLVTLLRAEAAAEEMRKILAQEEERRAAEEEEKRRLAAIEEERRAAEEEEKRRLAAIEEERRIAEERRILLESVSASLQSAAVSSQALSSGTESVEGYDGEFELE